MTSEFSHRTRAASLAAMAKGPLDLLVIGGGIVGAWIALTAVAHGYRAALVEKGDFASGTSGKTSRLLHGGLRYLQQFRLGLVKQAARERDALLRIAPSLVSPVQFVIPVYRGRGPRRWQLRLGLWLYDALSKDKTLPRRRWLSREEALRLEPRLRGNDLLAAAMYSDALTHDARLVMAVVRTAAHRRALVANYARVAGVLREGGRVVGAHVVDEETGTPSAVRAHAVVNATGVWAPDLQAESHRLRMRPTMGIHVFLPRERIGNRHAVVMAAPDGRIVFALPWGPFSLVGTTDTDYAGDRDRVEADRRDVDYLLDVVNASFPEARVTAADVVSTYAGLRPLLDRGEVRESDISRAHEVSSDPDDLVTVAGGKLTTARAMAEDVLAVAAKRMPPERAHPADTRTVRIEDVAPPDSAADLAAAVTYAARFEMALHADDVLVRRLQIFYEKGDRGLGVAPAVIDALGRELGWDAARREAERARFHRIVDAANRWREGPHG